MARICVVGVSFDYYGKQEVVDVFAASMHPHATDHLEFERLMDELALHYNKILKQTNCLIYELQRTANPNFTRDCETSSDTNTHEEVNEEDTYETKRVNIRSPNPELEKDDDYDPYTQYADD